MNKDEDRLAQQKEKQKLILAIQNTLKYTVWKAKIILFKWETISVAKSYVKEIAKCSKWVVSYCLKLCCNYASFQ